MVWTKLKDGKFTIKSLYKALELERRGFSCKCNLELMGATKGGFLCLGRCLE